MTSIRNSGTITSLTTLAEVYAAAGRRMREVADELAAGERDQVDGADLAAFLLDAFEREAASVGAQLATTRRTVHTSALRLARLAHDAEAEARARVGLDDDDGYEEPTATSAPLRCPVCGLRGVMHRDGCPPVRI